MKNKLFAGFAVYLSAFMMLGACAGGTPVSSTSSKNSSDKTSASAFDATKLPFYKDDIDSLEYTYSDDEMITPYWQGNVMYNEQLMIVEKDGVTQGKLLYPALRVISVRDNSLKKEYTEGVDYTIEKDTITLPEGSSIPVFKDEWSKCENIPDAYPEGDAGSGYVNLGGCLYTESSLIWGNYINVTYVYDPSLVDRDLYASYNDDLYGLHDLFKTKEEVNLVVFGDSISEGHSSSGLWNHEPYQPQYAKLVAKGIEKYGSVKVNFTNLSVGGKDSDWAAEEEQIDKLTKAEPDILIVAFGTNDTAAHLSSKRYANNIRTIIESARSVNPSCQIVLVAPFSSNPESKGVAAQQDNVARLKEIVASEDYLDVICVDMYAPTAEMLTKKNYYEISGNGINHPNDFIHRIYAMNILSAMFDLSQKS